MTAGYSERVEAIGRASRRAALLSALGISVVIVSMVYASVSLRRLQGQRDALNAEVRTGKMQLDSLRHRLADARQAVAATRTAINAFHANNYETALQLYDEAIRGDPDNPYVHNLRAYALFKLGRVHAAIEGERKSVATDPEYAWGYLDLARFLCADTPPRYDEAKQAIQRAIELRPELRAVMNDDGEFQRLCRPIIAR